MVEYACLLLAIKEMRKKKLLLLYMLYMCTGYSTVYVYTDSNLLRLMNERQPLRGETSRASLTKLDITVKKKTNICEHSVSGHILFSYIVSQMTRGSLRASSASSSSSSSSSASASLYLSYSQVMSSKSMTLFYFLARRRPASSFTASLFPFRGIFILFLSPYDPFCNQI